MSHIYSVERGSIENHESEIKRITAERHLTVSPKHWFILPAISGKSIWNQPEVIRLRASIQNREIDGIVFTKVARVCRSMKELKMFAEFFDQHGAHMISLQENFDTSTKDGKRLLDLLGMLAEWEREWISERVTASIVPRAEKGSNLGGPPKYGFQWEKSVANDRVHWELEINPEEIKVCQCIRDCLFRTHSLRGAAREVNKHYKTRHGHSWSDSRIRNILTDPIYRGDWLRNTTTCPDGIVKYKKPSEYVLLSGHFPKPVFSKSDASKIDMILDSISSNYTKPLSKQKYLLTQVKCTCGGKVYGRTERSGSRHYKCNKCSNKVSQQELDDLILNELANLNANKERLSELEKQISHSIASVDKLVNERNAKLCEIKKVEESIAATIEIEGRGVLENDSTRRSLRTFENRRREICSQVEEIDALIKECIKLRDVKDYLEKLKDLPAAIKSMTENQRSRLIGAIIPEVLLDKSSITYTLDFIKQFPALDQLFKDPTNPAPIFKPQRGNLPHTGRGSGRRPA
jgi:site-specific DNA recombinase